MTSEQIATPIPLPILIPAPKQLRHTGSFEWDDGSVWLETAENPALLVRTAARELAGWLTEHWDGEVRHMPTGVADGSAVAQTPASDAADGPSAASPPAPYRIRLLVTEPEGERYNLRAERDGTVIQGSPHGVLHGVRTLLQLLEPLVPLASRGGLILPLVEIEDEPDLPVRGIFAECHWGSDLMELDDWLAMVDELAALKLNTLSIGIYGCWYSRYPTETNSRSEFLFAPVLASEAAPRLRRIHYFDPLDKTGRTYEYEPALLAEGALERLIAYARDRGVRIVPQFNGPGHSLLIPRLYPEVSATDKAGEPTGDGYTLTHPETLPLLKSIMGRIVERYMKPYGQTWFHIGMDEISRWSETDLARHSPRELLELYLTEIGGYLLQLGMEKIVLWHDMAESLTGFDEAFEQLLERCGLAGKVVVQWWRYSEPTLAAKPVRGAESWMAPSTGYLAGMYYEDFVENVEQMVNEGVRTGASGVVAYALYSPTLRRNTAFLAEKGWNTRKTSAETFEQRYARRIGGDQGALERAEGMRLMRHLFQYSPASMLLKEIAVFGGNRPSYKRYPARVIDSMLAQPGTYQAYQAIQVMSLKAMRAWEQGSAKAEQGDESAWNIFECRRAAGIVGAMLALADAVRAYRRIAGDEARVLTPEAFADAVEKLRTECDAFDELLLDMWSTLPRYYTRVACREYAALREAMQAQLAQLEQLEQLALAAQASGSRLTLPDPAAMSL